MVERSGNRVLAALMALEEALAAEDGGRATVTLPEAIGRGAQQGFAARLAGLARPIGPGRDFAAGTVTVKSGFRWGRLMVLWASPAAARAARRAF